MITKPKKGDPIKAEWGQEVVEMLTKAFSGDPQPPAKPRKGDIIQPEWGEAVVDCLTVLEPWINFGWRHYKSFVLSQDTQDWSLDISDTPDAIAYLIFCYFYNAHQTETADLWLKDTSPEPRIVGGFYGMNPGNRGFSICIGSIIGGEIGMAYGLWYGANLDERVDNRDDTDFFYYTGQLRFTSTYEGAPAGLIGRGSKVIILYWNP